MPVADEILDLTHQLLTSISQRDWSTYARLCADDLTAFEPEAEGHLVEGLAFHQFYFEPPLQAESVRWPTLNSLAGPQVRMLGNDVAMVTFTRLVQRWTVEGTPETAAYNETRVWQRGESGWKHVHFHRSAV